MSIGENIKKYRTEAGMSQADLGKALGFSAQAVSKWENGKTEPDSKSVNRMCVLFNTTPNQLYGYTAAVSGHTDTQAQVQDITPNMGADDLLTGKLPLHPRAPDIGAPSGGVRYSYDNDLIRGKVDYIPITNEAKILSKGVDRMPEADRKKLLKMVDLMFEAYAEFFTKGNDENDT